MMQQDEFVQLCTSSDFLFTERIICSKRQPGFFFIGQETRVVIILIFIEGLSENIMFDIFLDLYLIQSIPIGCIEALGKNQEIPYVITIIKEILR